MANLREPLIAVTLGDPTGVGPEVVIKALTQQEVYEYCRPVVVGNCAVLERDARTVGAPIRTRRLDFDDIDDIDKITPSPQEVFVIEAGPRRLETLPYGRVHPDAGRAALTFIETAARLALDGRVAGMTTAPINKEALAAAGSSDVGHQEVLQRMSGAERVGTMLVAGPLRAVHLSTHHSLAEAVRLVKRQRILDWLRLTDRQFKSWGFSTPRIAVAALNPHGGDGGLIGREEIEEIRPAVEDAQKEGMEVSGPYPVDSLFPQARDGRWDAILVHYHDQGHIPIKMHDLPGSVSVNVGLPFVRTSVDHGTAFDIAGKGVAEATGMLAALRLCARLASAQGFEDRTDGKGASR